MRNITNIKNIKKMWKDDDAIGTIQSMIWMCWGTCLEMCLGCCFGTYGKICLLCFPHIPVPEA